jgi:hypothetical protein
VSSRVGEHEMWKGLGGFGGRQNWHQKGQNEASCVALALLLGILSSNSNSAANRSPVECCLCFDKTRA